MNDLRKKDSVADSIQSILEKELSPKQKKIAKMSPPEDKIDAGDLAKLRAGHKPVKSEGVDEAVKVMRKDPFTGDSQRYVRGTTDPVAQAHRDKTASAVKTLRKQTGLFGAKALQHSPKTKQAGLNVHPNRPFKAEGVDEEIDPKNTTTDTLKGREKKSSNRFLSKKVFMDVPGDVNEEIEQIDELKKSTVKSYIAKKSEKLPGKDPKKDMANLMTAHHRVTGVKPTSESFKTFRTFKEEIQEPILDEMINEVLGKDASAGDWIHDFVHSDNPKFAGKSKAKRKEMALAAYYAKQRNEEVDVEEDLPVLTNKDMHNLELKSQKDQLKRVDAKRRFSDKLDAMANYRTKTMGLPKINEGDEDETEESANPFSPDYKSQMKSKPGEKAGFDSKKISTGTVYSKKHKAEPEDEKKK